MEVVAGTLSSARYQADVTLPAGGSYTRFVDVNDANGTAVGSNVVNNVISGNILKTVVVEANNVAEEEVVVKLHAPNGNALPSKTLKISAAGAIEVSTESVTTDRLGEASFKISGSQEGTL